MSRRIGCAILGATGAVGQRFIERLHDHPTFEIHSLVASARSAGKAYGDAAEWILDSDLPETMAGTTVEDLDALLARQDVRVVFSAIPGKDAGPAETRLAEAGFAVFTNASAHRMDEGVPLLIPEVNPDDLTMVEGKEGFIVANGNCSGIVLILSLAPLRTFGIEELHVTTLQGLSGAGYPGVSAMDVIDNVVPHIGGEEDKLREEPAKTLGVEFPVHATCTRVPVREGHLESVHVRLARAVTAVEVAEAMRSFHGPDELAGLPNAPVAPIIVTDDPSRPQPRRDRDAADGMAITVGRIRVSDDGRHLQYVVLGHNTVRGAAGQSVLNAEFAEARGLL